jgi:hypothetical protein
MLMVLIPYAGLAQGSASLFDKAPPNVDEALRERIQFFYQSHVDGKFRQADTVVHEDSKDAFFVADKSQYKEFEIIKIDYEPGFERAKAVVAVGTDFFVPGAGKMPVTIPLTTFWKLDGGEWWWYVKPPSEEGTMTPFGRMKAGDGASDPASPYYKLEHMPGVADIKGQVEVSETDIRLDCSAPDSAEIVVDNGMAGTIHYSVMLNTLEGVTVTTDTTDLGANEQGHITIACEAREDLAGKQIRGTLSIRPTGHQIPITVNIAKALTQAAQ